MRKEHLVGGRVKAVVSERGQRGQRGELVVGQLVAHRLDLGKHTRGSNVGRAKCQVQGEMLTIIV